VSANANKEIALNWIEAAVSGDAEKSLSYIADDCRFLIVGEMPFCGWMDRQGFMEQAAYLPLDGPITMKIGAVVAEGDHVWFEAESSATLADGADYNNAYVFMLRIQAGKIVEYKEFTDTLHVWRKIDSPQVRGELTPRANFVTATTRELRGNSIGSGESSDI